MKNILDSHVHLDLIARHHPQRIRWLKENGCSVVSWSYFEGVESVSRLEACLQAKADCIRTHATAGLNCRYLAGIHPRSMPPDLKPEQRSWNREDPLSSVKLGLKPAMPFVRAWQAERKKNIGVHTPRSLCLGIGEIGLETGDAKEQEVFVAQLELGRHLLERKKNIGVHTPRSHKRRVTAILLKTLDLFSDLSRSLVVDHCTVETIGAVIDAGFWAGVTLSPPKTSWPEMKRIISTHAAQLDRIMCNTDSGSTFFEDAVRFRHNDDLPEALREKLFYLNASTFFNLF
jgi:predicted metal-dependent TIM-barrel fold hydrolase